MSFAVAQQASSRDSVAVWKISVETILQIIDTIIDHPKDAKFYSLNLSNEIFAKR